MYIVYIVELWSPLTQSAVDMVIPLQWLDDGTVTSRWCSFL